jgi:hypothetical protein
MSDPLTRPANQKSIDEQFNEIAPLFAPAPPPTTQRLAHARAAPRFTERKRKICELLDARGAMAIFQVAEALGYVESAISGRFSDLVQEGLIEDTGERIDKPSTGSPCKVFRRTRISLPPREEGTTVADEPR